MATFIIVDGPTLKILADILTEAIPMDPVVSHLYPYFTIKTIECEIRATFFVRSLERISFKNNDNWKIVGLLLCPPQLLNVLHFSKKNSEEKIESVSFSAEYNVEKQVGYIELADLN